MQLEENRARAVLESARTEINSGNTLKAIEKLAELYGRKFDSVTLECIDLYVELCLCRDDGKYVEKLDLSRIRQRLRNIEQPDVHTETLVEIVMKHFRTMHELAMQKVQSMISAPTQEDLVLAALSGVPLDRRAHERYMAPCVKASRSIAREFFMRGLVGVSKKVIHVFNRVAIDFTTYMKEVGMKESVDDAASFISQTLNTLLFSVLDSTVQRNADTAAARNDFIHSETSGEETVRMLCFILNLVTELRLLPQVVKVVSLLKKVSDALYEERGARELKSVAYQHIGDAFWTCKYYEYHAHCVTVAASVDETMSTRAVLAALSCADVSEEDNMFSVRHNTQTLPQFAELFVNHSTSKNSILSKMEMHRGFLSALSPAASTLLAGLWKSTTKVDFRALHAALDSLIAQDASLQQYESHIRQAILRKQLSQLSTDSHVIEIQSLYLGNAATVSQSQYLHIVEPAILSNSTVHVEIDSKLATISFRNAAQNKMLQTFTQLAQTIEVTPSAAGVSVDPKYNAASVSAAPAVSLERLTADHERALNMRRLQAYCVGSAAKRREAKEAAVIEKAERRIDERRENEEKARQRLQEAKRRKDLAQYRERQRQERQKLVLGKLRSKYPGFKVDDAIAQKSASAFEDELTNMLASFKRRIHVGDRDDVLRGNLYERTLRRLEIPKRKALDEQNAAQNRLDREAARRNNLVQHRKEFDKRQEDRAVLKNFLTAAEGFEQQWMRKTTQGATSKREEQQNLLAQERERLAKGE